MNLTGSKDKVIVREKGDEDKILPKKLQRALLGALKDSTVWTPMRSVMVSEAFLRMFVETVGHYREFITEDSYGAHIFVVSR